MNRILRLAAPWFLLAALPAGVAAQDRGKKEKDKGAVAASSGFTEDKGRFRVVVDGQPVGTEEFQISRAGNDWVARAVVEMPAPGGAISRLSGRLKVAADGAPQQYEYDWSPHAGKKVSATTVFQGGTAKIETQMEGATPFSQEFVFDTPRVAILDNNLYHHYAILARLYDWEKKGAQTFPVLIPQDQTPGSIAVEWAGTDEIAGKRVEKLRVRSADLEIELYLDTARRLLRLSVPASKAEVIRDP